MKVYLPRLLCLATAILFVLALSHQSRAGLVNGGFETGDFSNWNTVPTGQLDVVQFAHTGQYSARFGVSVGQPNLIQQDISLLLGATYKVELWVHNSGVGSDKLRITDQQNFDFTMDPVSTQIEEWEKVSFEFTYNTATNNPFSIWGEDQTSAVYVDDVSIELVNVPEPSSAIMGGFLLLGGLVSRRRS